MVATTFQSANLLDGTWEQTCAKVCNIMEVNLYGLEGFRICHCLLMSVPGCRQQANSARHFISTVSTA